jgi:hypothetical protein
MHQHVAVLADVDPYNAAHPLVWGATPIAAQQRCTACEVAHVLDALVACAVLHASD